MTRYAWLLVLSCLGCQSWRPGVHEAPTVGAANAAPPPAVPRVEPTVSRGQKEEEPPVEIRVAAKSPDTTHQHLVLAVNLLEAGEEESATEHLKQYVTQRPDQWAARAQLGELLFRREKFVESRLQFELFVALAQEKPESIFRTLIHCHSRLVEIAEIQEDDYQEHLNRGIGLYLLACRRATEPDPEGEHSATSLFCRAAAALQEAREEQPEEARPHFYLYQVWKHLGQHSAAARALAAADAFALLSRLTPAERRDLQLACLDQAAACEGGFLRQ
jgi:hypothetical protein